MKRIEFVRLVSRVNKPNPVSTVKMQYLPKKILELQPINLFCLTKTLSPSGKRSGFVIVDDFSRFRWVLFLSYKDDSFEVFRKFRMKRFENCFCKE